MSRDEEWSLFLEPWAALEEESEFWLEEEEEEEAAEAEAAASRRRCSARASSEKNQFQMLFKRFFFAKIRFLLTSRISQERNFDKKKCVKPLKKFKTC